MSRLAVVTPSYAPDYEIFRDLHRSVLAMTPETTVHHVIVSARDRALFAGLTGPRCRVWTYRELLPRRFATTAGVDELLHRLRLLPPSKRVTAVNLRRPYPPVRGWVMQQVMKMEAAGRVDADVTLFADSDVVLVRPVTAETFATDGRVRMHRRPGAVDRALPRHLTWHRVARELLGLPPADPPLPDYVVAFGAWDRATTVALQQRIEQVAGRPWMDVVAGQLDVSEWILYGVFVDEVLGGTAAGASATEELCHSYWDLDPLDDDAAATFVAGLSPRDVAVLIQSKSGTPLQVRRQALASLR